MATTKAVQGGTQALYPLAVPHSPEFMYFPIRGEPPRKELHMKDDERVAGEKRKKKSMPRLAASMYAFMLAGIAAQAYLTVSLLLDGGWLDGFRSILSGIRQALGF